MIWSYGIITFLYVVLRYFDLHRVTLDAEDMGKYHQSIITGNNIIYYRLIAPGLDTTIHKQNAYCSKECLKWNNNVDGSVNNASIGTTYTISNGQLSRTWLFDQIDVT